jgi:hypothetical protein
MFKVHKPHGSVANSLSKMEIYNDFSGNPLRELCNLDKGLLAFGVFGKNCLRLLCVGVLHNNEPVSGIWTDLKAAQPISDPVFEIVGLQGLCQWRHFIDGTTSIVGDSRYCQISPLPTCTIKRGRVHDHRAKNSSGPRLFGPASMCRYHRCAQNAVQ